MSVQKITPPAPFMANEPIETFVGREKDLEELHHIIANRGISAITGKVGTGGIGKTELARMYAKRYKGYYPHGVFWASMMGSSWREEAQKIINALHPETKSTCFFDDGKAQDEICKILNKKKALLIIDNAIEASEIIRPDCSVLVTTRDKKTFGIISRIAIKELDRLSEDDSVNLVSKILGKARVARGLSGASRIVEILGGIPLAIHIAARHLEAVPDLSFTHYTDQIKRKVKELKLKDSEDKAVIASLELSLGQLGNIPRGARLFDLFEAASVCAESGFTALSLMETAGLGVDQVIVEELHRRSLLEFDQSSLRYSMHPLLRQLSSVRLKMDEDKEFQYKENHCMHFLRFAKSLHSSPDMLIAERDGLWQAMTQARQIGREREILPRFLEHLIQPFHQLTASNDYEGAFRFLVATDLINLNDLGLVTDLESILKILAENQAGLQEPSRARVYTSLGNVYIRLGRYAKAISFYEQALEIYREVGDASGQGKIMGSMGDVAFRMDDYDKAISCYERSLEVYRQIGDIPGQGKVLGSMGIACADRGEETRAIRFYEKQLEISRLTGDLQGESNVLGNMGLAYIELGEFRRAVGFYEKQLELTRRTADAQAEGNALGNMGIAYTSLGEYARAIDFYKKQVAIHKQIGYVLGEGNALGNMGMAYSKIGMHEEAHRCFEVSKNIFHGLGLKDVVAQIEEMMQNSERWILRSVGLEWGKGSSPAFPGKKTPNRKLNP
jgi:tetratricopeptide (TPR) repeat protein